MGLAESDSIIYLIPLFGIPLSGSSSTFILFFRVPSVVPMEPTALKHLVTIALSFPGPPK